MMPRRSRETQRTGGLALGNLFLDDGISVLGFDVVFDAELLQVIRQHFCREARLLLVEIHRDDAKVDRRALAQGEQNIRQRV